MANKKISEVNQVNGLAYLFGRQSGDIVQSEASKVNVGGLTGSLTKTGLSSAQVGGTDRFHIVDGTGYSVFGDLVLVQTRITALQLIPSGEFRFAVLGYPNPPSYGEVALSCAVQSDQTSQTLWAYMDANGSLSIYSETDVPSGLNLVITGIYMKG